MGEKMPYLPKVPCRYPGCPSLVEHGANYCEKHLFMLQEGRRSSSALGYGKRWQKARKVFLEAHPLCVICLQEGKYTKATDVDHIIPHRGDPGLFWNQSNWQALCHSHHSQKTRNEDETPEYHY